MVGRLQSLEERLHTRRCVACGYDGGLLRNGRAPRCARCGCDLAERPAKSYAEMEGLTETTTVVHRPATRGGREQRLVQRWLVFLFFAVIGLLLLGYLTTEAVAIG